MYADFLRFVFIYWFTLYYAIYLPLHTGPHVDHRWVCVTVAGNIVYKCVAGLVLFYENTDLSITHLTSTANQNLLMNTFKVSFDLEHLSFDLERLSFDLERLGFDLEHLMWLNLMIISVVTRQILWQKKEIHWWTSSYCWEPEAALDLVFRAGSLRAPEENEKGNNSC